MYTDDSLSKIHKRHQDRLDSLSVVAKLSSTDRKEYETRLYTERGIMEICRWSNKPKANQFMDWVWDIVEKYRNHEFIHTSQQDDTLNEKLVELLTLMDNRLSKLEEQSNKKKLPEKKYSRWKTNTFKKLNTLQDYVNENSDEVLSLPNIMHLVIGETEDIYNIEVNEYVDLYRCEFSIDPDIKVQVLDAINHYKDVRDMFTLTLDSIMEKLHIAGDLDCSNKPRNIFDELADKAGKDLEK